MNPTALDEHAYRTAEQLLRHNRPKLVSGGRIRPRWIEGGARFWYRIDTSDGLRFLLVDPGLGSRKPAFDHVQLAKALSAATGEEVDAAALPFAAFELVDGDVEFDAFGQRWRWVAGDHACVGVERSQHRQLLDVAAPDGRHAVFRKDYNLWVRSLSDGRNRALTDNGSVDRDYGANPDYFMYTTMLGKLGIPHLPPAVLWSPDSKHVLTHRTDMRGVRETHLIEALPADGGAPRLRTQRFAFAGDERVPSAEFVVLDVESGKVVPARAEPVGMSLMSPISRQWAWWAEDSSAAYYLSSTRDGRELSLHRLDPASGEVRTILTESGPTRVEPGQLLQQAPIVRVLSDGAEVLWYSQRDNWGHLYLYGTRDGELRAQVTSGPWAVQEILRVDEDRRVVYFVVAGLVEEDPYRRSVCRVGLDGSGFAKIIDDDVDHAVTVPPGAGYFIDSASTNALAPVISVRDWDGKVLVELSRADTSRLLETGWSPPERFRVTAADGQTEIHGMLYLPHGFDPAKRYPVVDHPYGFPSASRVVPCFDPGYYGFDAEALAALGFVVVAIDGRGSPGRDKAFHDASYGRVGDGAGLADHVAALRELARDRPWMDLDRVGVFGMSSGGFATVRAMLEFPEVFKVGVAECGMHDLRFAEQGIAEMYNGPFDPETYAATSNIDLADRLVGKLLLVHGGLDDSFSPHLSMRLAERLIAADKDFDMLIVPSSDHAFVGYDHHLNRRRWDFFVRHLMGVEPPSGYRLTPVPLDQEALADLFG
ncbi:dipeptidyl-peptidase-4 [Streptomyces sp. SAI-135]|uniref:S9 family peptidase n=1 Tax=unclassified Streptomyces TaxID=2593676 RepID=UPI0024751760|nr:MULTISPECIES: DPP IV N-terminal domain-containing protein [unclassified Streptomyces]MDH6521864.1 dipeptidyl-peptidase-4 [Streptomyces sp. SAI-090]MDH6573230.1 dipeptidyl-peptidase-4 [Streptomyces sp. SAI-117]MDH6614035.1 dipeptidyl-peptidase-4 [Streptomyces sp. SAI-135]